MNLSLFGRWTIDHWRYLVIAAMALVFWLVMLIMAPSTPLTNPDSFDYINHSSYRLSGYPLFLRLFGLQHILVWQTLLLAASIAYLAVEIVRQSGRLWMAAAVLILLMANSYMVSFAYSILSEAFFVPVVAVLMGAVVRFSSKPSIKPAVFVGVAAGLACTIRPTGVALAAAAFLLVLLLRGGSFRRTVTLMAAMIAPIVILIAGEQIYNRAVHGNAATSLAGPHLMAKAAMIETPPLSPGLTGPEKTLAAWIENNYAPARAMVANSPNTAVRLRMMLAYESCAADTCGDAARQSTGLPRVEANRLSFRLALKRIARNPVGLLALDWKDYWCLWTVFHDPSLTPAFNDYVAAHRPLPFQDALGNRLDPFPKSRIGAIGNLLMLLIGWGLMAATLTGGWLVLRGRTSSPRLVIAVTAAALVQFLLVMTCLTAPSVSRFVLGVWPAVSVALVYNAAVVWPVIMGFIRSRVSSWGVRSRSIVA